MSNELNTWLERLRTGVFANASSARKSLSKTSGISDRAKSKASEEIDLYFGKSAQASTPTPSPTPEASVTPAPAPSRALFGDLLALTDIRLRLTGAPHLLEKLDRVIESKLDSL